MNLRADCSQCQALCCVALAFDRSDMFAIDKPAGVACPNLADDYGCKIHEQLGDLGFAGCQKYDCLGAGQRIVNEVFPNVDWMNNASQLRPIMAAFAALRKVHELLELLLTAQRLPLAQAQAAICGDLIAKLSPPAGWHADALKEFEQSDVARRVNEFLSALRDLPAIQIRAEKTRKTTQM